jgi:hypothetical protein
LKLEFRKLIAMSKTDPALHEDPEKGFREITEGMANTRWGFDALWPFGRKRKPTES